MKHTQVSESTQLMSDMSSAEPETESVGVGDNSRKTYYCGHCSKDLSKTLYFQHRKLFFDRRAKQWRDTKVYQDLGEDFDFDGRTYVDGVKDTVFHIVYIVL